MPVIAITLTVVSACAINVGKGIQKKASKSLPKLSLASLRSYLTDPNWRRGLELDVIGGAGMLLALSIAPMSVVQPASASGGGDFSRGESRVLGREPDAARVEGRRVVRVRHRGAVEIRSRRR